MLKLILSIFLVGGLLVSTLAQVEQATRYRVTEDNITTVAEHHNFTSSDVQNVTDLRILANRSNSQLDELGSRYGWVRSNSQLEELGSRYGWVRSNSQLDELGSRYGWVRSNSQLDELGSRYGWVR